MSDDRWTATHSPLDKPSPARMYDYYLGGNHHLAVDRRAAEQVIALQPDTPLIARANRAFLQRAVHFLVAQGLDQFLDIGSGIPTVGNVHEAAQRLNPAAHVVYVDSDPTAVALSQHLLHGNSSATAIQADARQPEHLLSHPDLRRLLDFRRPVGVLLVGFLYFITDDAEASHLVQALRDTVVAGSYLALSHATYRSYAVGPGSHKAQVEGIYAQSTNPVKTRSYDDIAAFFEGLDLVEPGLVYLPKWRPDGPSDLLLDQPERSAFLAGVARKP